MEGDQVIAACIRYIATVGPRYRALVHSFRPNDWNGRTSGRTVRPSEDEHLQAEWYRGGSQARRL
jgi:hypothetical protein